MLSWLTRRTADAAKASELYGAVVAAARQPVFYSRCGIQDTPEGRYELIVLHLFLLVDRVAVAGPKGAKLAQLVVEELIRDLDDTLREMGVGDLSVPTKVKKAVGGFYERSTEYKAAISASPGTLTHCLDGRVPGLAARPGQSAALERYIYACRDQLSSAMSEPFAVPVAARLFPPFDATQCDERRSGT